MPSPSGIKPALLRTTYLALSGIDLGQTFDNSDILIKLIQQSGILPVVPVANPPLQAAIFPLTDDQISGNTAPIQTLVNQASTTAGTAITNASNPGLYTVPAGKTFYLTTFAYGLTSGSAGFLGLFDGGTADIVSTSITAANQGNIYNFPVPIKVAGGTTIKVNSTVGSTTMHWNLVGWLQ